MVMITGLVLVTIIASPRAMLSEPSVTRKDGIDSCVVRMPLSSPTRAPVPSPATAPTIQLLLIWLIARAAAMPDSANVEATDRSI
ncbi:hypothetical protein ACVWYH_000138 [Bradyrhizobium sp. GM24.11]